MTELDLTTLSARIRDHKRRLVEIVKPPVCTERARHYTKSYQANIDKPIVVRRALALAHHLQQRTIWIDNDELIIGNQASRLRAAPIFPEYTVAALLPLPVSCLYFQNLHFPALSGFPDDVAGKLWGKYLQQLISAL